MAVDSRNKRASVIGYTLPFGVLPNPDSAVDSQDRAQVVAQYAAENFSATVFATIAETQALPTQAATVYVQVQATAAESQPVPEQSAAVAIQVQATAAQTQPLPTQSASVSVAGFVADAPSTGGWVSDPYRRQSRRRDEEVRQERIRLGILDDDAPSSADTPQETVSKAPARPRKRAKPAAAPVLSDGEITRLIAALEDDAARQRRRRIAAILLLAA